MLDRLPEHVLGNLCRQLRSRDLAVLEAVSRHFRSKSCDLQGGGGKATVAECGAELRVRGYTEGWRVEKRPDESWKYVLAVVEDGVLAALSTVSAGGEHTLVRDSAAVVFAFGHNDAKQLGLGDSEEVVDRPPWNEWFRDDHETSPCEVERLRGQRVVSVAAGVQHSLALTQEGRILTGGGGQR